MAGVLCGSHDELWPKIASISPRYTMLLCSIPTPDKACLGSMQDGMWGDKSRICHRLSPNIDGAGAGQPKKAVWAYLSMEITPPIPTTPKIHHQHLCFVHPLFHPPGCDGPPSSQCRKKQTLPRNLFFGPSTPSPPQTSKTLDKHEGGGSF